MRGDSVLYLRAASMPGAVTLGSSDSLGTAGTVTSLIEPVLRSKRSARLTVARLNTSVSPTQALPKWPVVSLFQSRFTWPSMAPSCAKLPRRKVQIFWPSLAILEDEVMGVLRYEKPNLNSCLPLNQLPSTTAAVCGRSEVP